MAVIRLADLPARDIFPGFRARLVHTGHVTHSWVEAEAGAEFPEHHHVHEQVVNVLEGELELVVGGETCRLGPGMVCVIPPHVPHSGRVLKTMRVLDAFAPVREDYR